MPAVKAVIDTNIWVSSLLNPFGFPAKLRNSFEEGSFNVVISVPMLEELAEVLNRPKIKNKFKIENDDIAKLLFLLEDRAEDVPVSGNIAICRDKDDDLVIETAIKGKAEYLVTRDDDIKFDRKVSSFLSQHSVKVISLSKFLAIISKS
ncbi:MAG: putative toxin-antitoxin system toxin component, PIN family [Nitrospirae bacterium]|nr:putative toxin-antitoxin system toxin component, PIN family [Nitrospirota bacterium]